MKTILQTCITFLFVVLLFTSCDFSNTTEEDQSRELKIVYTDWSESIALTHLTYVLLEDELGYNIELKLTDVENAYSEVAEGKADVFADAWLPETQKRYYQKHKDNIEKLGISFPDARTGFVVPDYSSLQKVEDLKSWDGDIVGIDEGAGVMIKAAKALEKVSSPAKLLALSESEMTTRLEEAIKRRENIIVTGWEPHWIFARYELRFLKDSDKIFGEQEKIYTIGHKGITKEHPVAARFFERMQMSEKQLNELVYEIQVKKDPILGAEAWIKKNEYVVNQWLKNLSPERKKIM